MQGLIRFSILTKKYIHHFVQNLMSVHSHIYLFFLILSNLVIYMMIKMYILFHTTYTIILY